MINHKRKTLQSDVISLSDEVKVKIEIQHQEQVDSH